MSFALAERGILDSGRDFELVQHESAAASVSAPVSEPDFPDYRSPGVRCFYQADVDIVVLFTCWKSYHCLCIRDSATTDAMFTATHLQKYKACRS